MVYLSGLDPTAPSFDPLHDTSFDLDDISSLKQTITDTVSFKGVDILLTSQWPHGVSKYGSEVVSIMQFPPTIVVFFYFLTYSDDFLF